MYLTNFWDSLPQLFVTFFLFPCFFIFSLSMACGEVSPRQVMFMLIICQSLAFLVCSLSILTWSLSHLLWSLDCFSWSCFRYVISNVTVLFQTYLSWQQSLCSVGLGSYPTTCLYDIFSPVHPLHMGQVSYHAQLKLYPLVCLLSVQSLF